MTTIAAGAIPVKTSAPLGRVLLAELRWILRRPRNILALLLLAAIPVLLGITIALSSSDGGGPSVLSMVGGSALALPIAAISIAQTMLLPLMISMVAADALAGEAAHGTLRGLLLAPVGRIRLAGVKAFGVLVMCVLAVGVVAVSGTITGLLLAGGQDTVSLSGTTLPTAAVLGRVALAVGWVSLQMAAVGSIALAISSLTEHPLVVMASTMGALILFAVLGGIPALSWLQPALITTNWASVTDVLQDPIISDNLVNGMLRASCYLVIGVSATISRMVTKDL